MSTYQYAARDMAGKLVDGTIEADSETEAATAIARRNLFPVTVKPQSSAVSFGKSAAGDDLSRVRVKGHVMATFYGQLASLLRSGVPMARSLSLLAEAPGQPGLAKVVDDVRSRVEDGANLGDAMGRYPRVFAEMAVNMVRAGSEGGFLEDALERTSNFTELQEDLKGRTVSAMAYPVFLFCVGSIVVVSLLVFFVPKFDSLFDRLRRKGEMPTATEALLSFSQFLTSYGWILLLLMVAAGFYVRMQLQTETGRMLFDKIKLKVPVLGSILMDLAVARFCRVLGTLLGNGVPILRSLQIAKTATGNRLLSLAITDATENIRGGDSLATPLKASGHFPLSVVEMIRVAEESNSLDGVLPDIADSLEKRTFRRLDLFVRLLEPLMLLVMAILVLGVVLALLVPVLKSSTTL